MSLAKTNTQSSLGDAAVRWVGGPGRKPNVTPQDEMDLSEADREKILNLIAERKALPLGTRRRRLMIGHEIWCLRHPSKREYLRELHSRNKKRWLENNPEKRKKVAMDWYRRNYVPAPLRVLSTSKVAVKARQRRKDNIQFCLAGRLRTIMGRALRRQFVTKSFRTFDLIGCSHTDLRFYITASFLPGMLWKNRTLWQVDHKRPIASFDLKDPAQQREAFHFSNLQPLWAIDNHRKGAKYEKFPPLGRNSERGDP